METDIVYIGDCAEVLATFPDACIDLTVTSPPYDNLRLYKGYHFDFEPIARQLYRVTKPGGVVVWVVGDATVNGSETGTSFRQALYFMECGFNLHDTMIYQVPGTGAKGSNYCYWQAFEYMFILSNGVPRTVNRLKDKRNIKSGSKSVTGAKGRKTGTRLYPAGGTVVGEYGYRDNVLRILAGTNGDDLNEHPAVFPEALARDHILSWSNPGDIVLDPMAGSGTTLKMAQMLERKYIGIEISAEYVNDIIKPRLAATNVPLPLFNKVNE